MDGGSMVGKTGRMGKSGNTGTDNADVFFYDVSHNCHNHNRSHHRICHIAHKNFA